MDRSFGGHCWLTIGWELCKQLSVSCHSLLHTRLNEWWDAELQRGVEGTQLGSSLLAEASLS